MAEKLVYNNFAGKLADLDGVQLGAAWVTSAYVPAATDTTVDAITGEVTGGSYARQTFDGDWNATTLTLEVAVADQWPTFDLSGIAGVCGVVNYVHATGRLVSFIPYTSFSGTAGVIYAPQNGIAKLTAGADIVSRLGRVEARTVGGYAVDPDTNDYPVVGGTGGGSSIIGDPVEVPRGVLTEAPVDADGKLTANVFIGSARDATGDDTDAFLALPRAADQDPGTRVYLLSADDAPPWGAAEVDDTPQPAKLTGDNVPILPLIGALAGTGTHTYSFSWQVAVNGTTHTITVSGSYNTNLEADLGRLIADIFDIPGTTFNLADWQARGQVGELAISTTTTGLSSTISVVSAGSGTPAGLASALGELIATDGSLGRITGVHDGQGGALGSEHYYTLADWTTAGTGTHLFTSNAQAQLKASELMVVPAENNAGVAKWTTVARVPLLTEQEYTPYDPTEIAGSPDSVTGGQLLDRILYFFKQGTGVALPARGDSVTPFGGGGGSVATDTIFDAKGDLPVGTGSNTAAKLTVGANDTILVADSGQTTGLKWADASTVRTALGLVVGTDVQAHDADLDALAALTTTSYGRSLLEAANAAALRTLAGLVIGTDVQAYDSDLAAIAALSTTTFGRSLLEQASAAAARSTLGAAGKDTDWNIANSFMSFRPTEASPGTYGSSVTITSGAMAATKIVIRQDTTISGAKLYVRTAGSAGAKVQVGIYALSGGKPNGAPLLTTGEVDVTSTGYKNPTFSGVALSAGAYAMVWWANDTGLKMQMVDPTTPGQTWPLGIDTDTLSGPTGLGWASTYASSMPTLTASDFTLQSSTGWSPLWCLWKVS